MVEAAIGISLVLNYVMSEYLGIISGGFVVPAYIAIFAHMPGRVIGTLIAALATFLTLKFLRNIIFIYGRRNLMLCLLMGFFYNYTLYHLYQHSLPFIGYVSRELSVIGNIVPGILAYWMEEQGVVRTLSIVWVNAILTSLLMMFIFGRVFAL